MAPLDLAPRRVVRQELGVDVQLANAAGDQLGELAAEVQDDDGVGLSRLCLGALGWRRVQRLLEIGLHLGIVRSQDPVARVGGLAMDRPATIAPGRRRSAMLFGGVGQPAPPATT